MRSQPIGEACKLMNNAPRVLRCFGTKIIIFKQRYEVFRSDSPCGKSSLSEIADIGCPDVLCLISAVPTLCFKKIENLLGCANFVAQTLRNVICFDDRIISLSTFEFQFISSRIV